MMVVSLTELEDSKGSLSIGGDVEFSFRYVKFEVGLGRPLEISRVQLKVCSQPLVKGHE